MSTVLVAVGLVVFAFSVAGVLYRSPPGRGMTDRQWLFATLLLLSWGVFGVGVAGV